MDHDHKCGYDGGINPMHDVDLAHGTEFNRILRVSWHIAIIDVNLLWHLSNLQYKRSPGGIQVRGPYNSNKRSSYVELVLVVDNKVFQQLDKNFTKVHQHCKDIANIINAVRNGDSRRISIENIYFCFSCWFSALQSFEYFYCATWCCCLEWTELGWLVEWWR